MPGFVTFPDKCSQMEQTIENMTVTVLNSSLQETNVINYSIFFYTYALLDHVNQLSQRQWLCCKGEDTAKKGQSRRLGCNDVIAYPADCGTPVDGCWIELPCKIWINQVSCQLEALTMKLIGGREKQPCTDNCILFYVSSTYVHARTILQQLIPTMWICDYQI